MATTPALHPNHLQLGLHIDLCSRDELRRIVKLVCAQSHETADMFATHLLPVGLEQNGVIAKAMETVTASVRVLDDRAGEVDSLWRQTIGLTETTLPSATKRKALDVVENEAKTTEPPTKITRLLPKAHTFANCRQCNAIFDTLEPGGSTDCVYHDGCLDVIEPDDDDFWADHDENCHGEIDSIELKAEYPERYRWDCCDEDGNAGGCTRTKHTANGHRGTFAELKWLGKNP